MKRAISDIRVGDRYRKSLGDLSDLIASIEDVGLLHPIVITEHGQLGSGQRRLAACCVMGWTDVPVTVATSISDAAALLRAERDENTCRLDMTRSESIRLGMVIEQIEKPKAADRRAQAKGQPQGVKKVSSEDSTEQTLGDVRDKAGHAIGMAGVTFNQAKLVVERADGGDPVAVAAMKEMDETTRIEPAYKKVRASKGREEIENAVAARGEDTRNQRQRQIDHKAFERWQAIIGTIGGIAATLPSFKLERAAYEATAEQLQGWDETLRTAAAELAAARKRLTGGGK